MGRSAQFGGTNQELRCDLERLLCGKSAVTQVLVSDANCEANSKSYGFRIRANPVFSAVKRIPWSVWNPVLVTTLLTLRDSCSGWGPAGRKGKLRHGVRVYS